MSAVAKVRRPRELKKRCGARRESLRLFWKPSPVLTALLSAQYDVMRATVFVSHNTPQPQLRNTVHLPESAGLSCSLRSSWPRPAEGYAAWSPGSAQGTAAASDPRRSCRRSPPPPPPARTRPADEVSHPHHVRVSRLAFWNPSLPFSHENPGQRFNRGFDRGAPIEC